MIRYTAIRLVEIAAILVLLSFIVYALIGLMPGDPIDLMRSSDPRMSAADAARLKALYGLDQPLLLRYAGWARQALAGDLGYSRLFAAPVWGALLPRLGNSRSEERRVGEECRSRGWGCEEKKGSVVSVSI